MAIRSAKLSDQPLCEYCQAEGRLKAAAEVDHFIPLFQGGTDEWENLRSTCIPCHKAKSLRERGAKERTEVNAAGWPIGEAHHWNQP